VLLPNSPETRRGEKNFPAACNLKKERNRPAFNNRVQKKEGGEHRGSDLTEEKKLRRQVLSIGRDGVESRRENAAVRSGLGLSRQWGQLGRSGRVGEGGGFDHERNENKGEGPQKSVNVGFWKGEGRRDYLRRRL